MAFSLPDSSSFFAAIAAMAEELRHTILSTSELERSEYINRLCVESDAVFGVWPDSQEPEGFGVYLIKGEQHLPAIAASLMPNEVKITAIPCAGFEQAVAAKEVWGDTDAPALQRSDTEAARGKGKKSRAARKRQQKSAQALQTHMEN